MLWRTLSASVSRCVSPETFAAIWSDETRRGRSCLRALPPVPPPLRLSLSLSQPVHLAHSCSLPQIPECHTCVARKSFRRHGNSCQASSENLSSHDPRGGRALAGSVMWRRQADSSVSLSRDSQWSNEIITVIRKTIKGAFPDFIITPSSLKLSIQLLMLSTRSNRCLLSSYIRFSFIDTEKDEEILCRPGL